MIIGSASNGLISRNPTWFDPSKDFTKSFYIRTNRTPLVNVTAWLLGADLAYTPPYIWFGTSVASVDNFFIEYDTGSGAVDSSAFAVAHNTNVYVSIRYTKLAHTLKLLFDGVVKTSFAANFDSLTAQPFEAMLNEGSSDDSTCNIAYERFYQRALTNGEILAEMASIIPVSSTGLLSTCPLQTSIDLTDHLGKYLAPFFATGTVTTDTTDPLLSVVAGPPTNVDPAHATSITTDSAYFQDTLTGGAATNVWHKYTAQPGDTVIGACSFGDLTTYKPTVQVYEGLANANSAVQFLSIPGNTNRPIQFPVVAGTDYYFKSTRNGAVTPATLQISVLKALNLPVPVGSIAVNDDRSGFSLALLDKNIGYPLRFINNFAAGEGADVVPVSGNVMASDLDDLGGNPNVKLYSFNYQTVLTSILAGDQVNTRVSFNNDKFLISLDRSAVNSVLRLASVAGTLDSTVFDLGVSSGPTAIALNEDATIAYYVLAFTTNLAVKSWNLVTNLAGANLVAGIANFNVTKNMIVLSDGKIIVPYSKGTATTDFKILAYSSAGATLHTYDLGAGLSNNDNQLAQALDNPNSFWAWAKHSDSDSGLSLFRNIKVSDGSTISETTGSQFEVGTYQQTATNTPVRFGHSESCPFWITRVLIGITNNAKSGLYILTGTGGNSGLPDNPILRHDVDWINTSVGTSEEVKIPDPYYDTYLAGDE